MRPLIRFTPPLLASRRIAGFVMPCALKIIKVFNGEDFAWMLSLNTLRCLLAPPFPNPLPPLPLPVMVADEMSTVEWRTDGVVSHLLIFYQPYYLFVRKELTQIVVPPLFNTSKLGAHLSWMDGLAGHHGPQPRTTHQKVLPPCRDVFYMGKVVNCGWVRVRSPKVIS